MIKIYIEEIYDDSITFSLTHKETTLNVDCLESFVDKNVLMKACIDVFRNSNYNVDTLSFQCNDYNNKAACDLIMFAIA